MPRQSAEDKAAAIFRRGGKHPSAPKHLGSDEKVLWREIVECRPVDFFQPGALHLLEQLCVMTIAARRIGAEIQENPADVEVVSRSWWKLGGAGTEGTWWGGSGGEVKVGG
jgi:hypothetical protein